MEGGTLTDGAVCTDRASMGFDDLLGDRDLTVTAEQRHLTDTTQVHLDRVDLIARLRLVGERLTAMPLARGDEVFVRGLRWFGLGHGVSLASGSSCERR